MSIINSENAKATRQREDNVRVSVLQQLCQTQVTEEEIGLLAQLIRQPNIQKRIAYHSARSAVEDIHPVSLPEVKFQLTDSQVDQTSNPDFALQSVPEVDIAIEDLAADRPMSDCNDSEPSSRLPESSNNSEQSPWRSTGDSSQLILIDSHHLNGGVGIAPPVRSHRSRSSDLRVHPSRRYTNSSPQAAAHFSPAPRVALERSNTNRNIHKSLMIVATCVSGSGNTLAIVEGN